MKKCAVNPIAINQDVVRYAKIELQKLNLEIVWVNNGNQQKRYKEMSGDVLKNVIKQKEKNQINDGTESNNDDDDNFMECPLRRNKDTIRANDTDNL